MTEKAKPIPPASHNARRVTIAVNVAASVILACALAALVNWLGYRYFVSADLTTSRRYTLSPQTHRILDNLDDDYRIVTLLAQPDARTFPAMAANVQAVRDLLDEYDRRSTRIDVEHLDPAADAPRVDRFLATMRDWFGDDLTPTDELMHKLADDFTSVTDTLVALDDAFKAVMVHPDLRDRDFTGFARAAAATIERLKAQTVDTSQLDADLPNYQLVLDNLRAQTRAISQAVDVIVDRFEQTADLPATTSSLKNELLTITLALRQPREALGALNDALAQVRVPSTYQALHESLGKPNVIVLLGGGDVRTVHLSEMLTSFSSDDASQAGRYLFLGEEKITGSLISMATSVPPRVVFVTPGPWPAYGAGGEYDHIAARLRAMGFEVTQWTPALRNRSTGAPMPTAALPQPKDGQKVVWVLQTRTLTQQTTPSLDSPQPKIITHLRDRVARGDRAMIVVGPEPDTPRDSSDPLISWLADWDITPLLEQAVAHEVPVSDRQVVGSFQFDVHRWPTDSPMARVLEGMVGHVTIAAPLVVGDGVRVGARTWPVIELTAPRMWAETTFEDRLPKYDDATASDRFVIAAAGERGDERIVVLSDPSWPSDRVTKAGVVDPESKQLLISRFPANAEFFINSIYWLAGQEDLIAISSRLQDIRRIEPMDAAQQRMVHAVLVFIMPAVPVLAGAAMWLIRRRG